MSDLIVGLYEDWLWLDERIETVTREIEAIAACPVAVESPPLAVAACPVAVGRTSRVSFPPAAALSMRSGRPASWSDTTILRIRLAKTDRHRASSSTLAGRTRSAPSRSVLRTEP
jgi:hypothetical protein